MTPAGIEITVAAIGSAGVMVAGFFQARRRNTQAADLGQLSSYAAHRLEDLDAEVGRLREEVDRLHADIAREREDMALELDDYRAQIAQRDKRIGHLESEVAELTRRLDVNERDGI